MCLNGVREDVKETQIRKWSDPTNWVNGQLP